jgi:hypothetical protein
MRDLVAGLAAALLLMAPPVRAQGVFVQVAAGGATGADYTSGSSHPGALGTAMLGAGLQASVLGIRLDARVFDTEAEPLLLGSITATADLFRGQRHRGYVLATAGTGAFLEEGDPGHHAGIGAGVRTTGRPAAFVEFRLDRLLGTFTYASRQRMIASAMVGIRVGRQ